MTRNLLGAAAIAASLAAAASPASAALYTNSFGPLVTGYVVNDDDTFGPVALPFSIDFFGTTYHNMIVSNNGNVQFNSNNGSYTPTALNIQTIGAMIAPFWTDLDSRSDPLGAIAAGTGGSAVYVNQVSTNQVVVTWDRLGYFSVNYSGRAQFQLVLNNPGAPIAVGEGAIGFFFADMTSGTDDHNVSSGFGDGLAAINPGEISHFSGSSAGAVQALNNSFVWFNLEDGAPVVIPPDNAVPVPATGALLLAGIGAIGVMRRRQS